MYQETYVVKYMRREAGRTFCFLSLFPLMANSWYQASTTIRFGFTPGTDPCGATALIKYQRWKGEKAFLRRGILVKFERLIAFSVYRLNAR